MRACLLILLLAGWAGEVRAQFWRDCTGPTWFVATPASYHADRTKDYREQHLGVGVERVCGTLRGATGVIPRNSNDDTTFYVGVAWMPIAWRDFRGGIFAGLFTGYSRPVLPAGALVGLWEPTRWRHYGLNLLGFPPYDKESDWVFVLQLKRIF